MISMRHAREPKRSRASRRFAEVGPGEGSEIAGALPCQPVNRDTTSIQSRDARSGGSRAEQQVLAGVLSRLVGGGRLAGNPASAPTDSSRSSSTREKREEDRLVVPQAGAFDGAAVLAVGRGPVATRPATGRTSSRGRDLRTVNPTQGTATTSVPPLSHTQHQERWSRGQGQNACPGRF